MKLVSFIIVAIFVAHGGAQLDLISCDFDLPIEGTVCHYESTSGRDVSEDWNQQPSSFRETYKIDGPKSGVSPNGSFIKNYQHIRIFYEDSANRLRSPRVHLSGPHCFSIDFYLFGDNPLLLIRADLVNANGTASLQVQLLSRNEDSCPTDKWNRYQKTIDFIDGMYEIVIRAKSNFNGTVAMDNLLFTEGRCQVTNSDIKSCDFDALIGTADNWGCDWIYPINNLGDNESQPWRVITDGGRFSDKSTRTPFGGYLASQRIEGGPQFNELQFGQFLPEGGAHCLSFWLNTGDGAYWKITETPEGGLEGTILESNDVDDSSGHVIWRYKSIDIDPLFPVNISLKARNGDRIFVDLFELKVGRCPRPMECSFADGPCGYTIVYSNSVKIGQGRGRYPESLQPYETNIANLNFERNYLYYDHTRPGTRSLTQARLTSDSHLHGGTYCYRLLAKLSDGSRIDRQRYTIIYNRMESGAYSYITSPSLTSRFYERDDDWLEMLSDVKSAAAFRMEMNLITRTDNVTTIMVRDTSLEDRTCDEYRARNRTRPVINFPEVNFHCYSTGHYIPQYRTCDGVIDCPMGEDEGEHCDNHSCHDEGLRCRARHHRFCLTDARRFCDGHRDCDDGVDEDPRLCNRDSFCESYCLNNGQCITDETKFGCDCHGASGKRCQLIL